MISNKLYGFLRISLFFLAVLAVATACDMPFGVQPVDDVPLADQPDPLPSEEQPPLPPPPLPPLPGEQAPPQDPPSPYTFNHITPLSTEVYYGPCTTQETLTTIQTAFSPLENIAGVYLHYLYQLNDGVSSSYYTVLMSELGIGDWIGDVDAGLEAASTLGTSNGQVYYVITIQDINGGVTYSPGRWIDVVYCSAAVAPPTSAPDPAPTSTVDPGDAQPPSPTGPTILYFNYTNPATEGRTIHLEWSIEGADCGVTLNGTDVNASGSQDDAVPLGNGGTTWFYILEAYGPPCDDSTYAFEEADVLIDVISAQVLTQFEVSLVTDDSVDFDSPSGSGDAVLMVHPNNDADGRLYFLQKSDTNTLLAGVSSQPSRGDCVSAINQWSSITVWLDEGFFFCFQTDQGHYGYFYRSGMAFDANKNTWEVSVSVTTWENP
jgi:hypothetical protein